MDPSIIVACITVAGALLGTMLTNAGRFARIERKLDEHNHYGQKFGEVSESFSELKISQARMEEQISTIRESLEELKK